MAYKDEVDSDCLDCRYYSHIEGRQYTAYGDPGEPEEHNCDLEWECPYLEIENDFL